MAQNMQNLDAVLAELEQLFSDEPAPQTQPQFPGAAPQQQQQMRRPSSPALGQMPPDLSHPMSGADMENSRRMVAEGTGGRRVFDAATSGLPQLAIDGAQNVYYGMQHRNPMETAKGAAQLASMPIAAAGRPFTAMGAMVLPDLLNTSMPSANAAEPGMPPIPGRNPPLPPPQQQQQPAPAPSPQPQASQSWIDTLARQAWDQNIVPAGQWVGRQAGNIYGELTATPEFKPLSRDEWMRQNGRSQLEAIKRAEQRSSSGVKGVNAREAGRIRDRNAAEAQRLREALSQEYTDYVRMGRDKFERDRSSKRFKDKYPTVNAMLKAGPPVAAGAAMALATRRHGRDVMRTARNVEGAGRNAALTGTARTRARDNIAETIDRRVPVNPLPYAVAGLGASSVGGVVIPDVYDYATLPEGPARRALENEFTTGSGLAGKVADIGARAGATAVSVGAGLGLGKVMSPLNRTRHYQYARDAAGLPNTRAMSVRTDALKRELAEKARAAEVKANSRGQSSAVARRDPAQQSQQDGPIPPGSGGTRQGGQGGAGNGPNPSRPQGPNPGQGQGGRGGGGSGASLTPARKLAIREAVENNAGKITAAQMERLAPGVPRERVQAYVNEQIARRARMSPGDYRKYMGDLTAAAGTIGVGGATANAMLQGRRDDKKDNRNAMLR